MRNRFLQYLKYQGISPNRAEELCGFSNGTLQKYFAGKNIGSDKIEKIVETFPSLNTEWWITGKGHMLVSTVVREGSNIDPIQSMASWMSKIDREIYLIQQKLSFTKES